MDSASKKKLIVPILVFLALLALNINSLVSGITHHQTSRVMLAIVSTAIIIVAFIVVLRSVKKNSN